MESIYEIQKIDTEDFSCLYHVDSLKKDVAFHPHWHENIEILNFVSGEATITLSGNTYEVSIGDTIVVNPNVIHHIYSKTDNTKYHVLIIEESFCHELGIYFDNIFLQEKFYDEEIKNYFCNISTDACKKGKYWKQSIMAKSSLLLIELCRRFSVDRDKYISFSDNTKIKITKDAICYMKNHFKDNISVAEISQKIGVSVYHLCRCFREVTKTTPVKYINLLRCSMAKTMLISSKYTVSEAAVLCGFRNMSYFTKTYKSYNGCNPSDEIVLSKEETDKITSEISNPFGCYG